VAKNRTCLSSKWQWQGLKIASHASLLVIHLAMGTPTKAAEAPATTEDETNTSSRQRGSKRSDQSASEEGFGRDEEFEVPEYERLRQENLRKNSLKLQELEIPALTASLNLSITTCTTSAVGGEGNHGNAKNTRGGGAISLACQKNGLGYRNPKP
jgi:hypothetical protein